MTDPMIEKLEELREKIAVLVQIAIVGYKIDGKQSDHAELFADRIWSLITRSESFAILSASREEGKPPRYECQCGLIGGAIGEMIVMPDGSLGHWVKARREPDGGHWCTVSVAPPAAAGTEGPGLRYPVELRCAELEEALKELTDACEKLPASDARVIGLIPIMCRAAIALGEGEKK